ncbi:unnamed protein product [Hydatigera taeniaeformis]|uniref:RHD domain-containing protein n=1 Tax=Hydatigena taeniaeformis TaxID=6205 RepID=A0A0R3WK48_HYDTA|nr:unnamed protein product [Hydatigera taeniaeformis]
MNRLAYSTTWSASLEFSTLTPLNVYEHGEHPGWSDMLSYAPLLNPPLREQMPVKPVRCGQASLLYGGGANRVKSYRSANRNGAVYSSRTRLPQVPCTTE